MPASLGYRRRTSLARAARRSSVTRRFCIVAMSLASPKGSRRDKADPFSPQATSRRPKGKGRVR